MPKIKYTPTWKTYEDKMHSDDPEEAYRATEAFITERELETKTSRQARAYEQSRKEAWAKEKPEWKKQQLQKEAEREAKIINDLRNGGVLMQGLRPAPGLLVIQTKGTSDQTESGIYIPDNVEYESNIATVVRVSDPRLTLVGEEKPPCKEGDEVLVRKGAGLNVKINGEACLIIRFDEVLGVLE